MDFEIFDGGLLLLWVDHHLTAAVVQRIDHYYQQMSQALVALDGLLHGVRRLDRLLMFVIFGEVEWEVFSALYPRESL